MDRLGSWEREVARWGQLSGDRLNYEIKIRPVIQPCNVSDLKCHLIDSAERLRQGTDFSKT
ncbi:hypothetical protein N9L68_03690 [bacterium]|nr:hypothetical protein [bacterium]